MKQENQYSPFCALEYRGHSKDIHMSLEASIILVVLKSVENDLSLLVHPEWRSMVEKQDLTYLESLFQDFLERARLRPEALFEQLCALGVGPLVTRKVGSQLSDEPWLKSVLSSFVQL